MASWTCGELTCATTSSYRRWPGSDLSVVDLGQALSIPTPKMSAASSLSQPRWSSAPASCTPFLPFISRRRGDYTLACPWRPSFSQIPITHRDPWRAPQSCVVNAQAWISGYCFSLI